MSYQWILDLADSLLSTGLRLNNSFSFNFQFHFFEKYEIQMSKTFCLIA